VQGRSSRENNSPVSKINSCACVCDDRNEEESYDYHERRQVVDVNDFDETLTGPWGWDVKRLAASLVIAGRRNGYTAKAGRRY
jgi:hypothetical protein